MYQQLQMIFWENVCRTKAFRANLEKFKQSIICTPKMLLSPTPIVVADTEKYLSCQATARYTVSVMPIK